MIIKTLSFYRNHQAKGKGTLQKLQLWIEDIKENEKTDLEDIAKNVSGSDAKFEPYEHGVCLNYEPGILIKFFKKIFSKDQIIMESFFSRINVYCTIDKNNCGEEPNYKMYLSCRLKHDKIIDCAKKILDLPYKFYSGEVRSDLEHLAGYARNGEKLNILPESEIVK